ncbi:MAG: DUF1638 domain-containing protein [Chloroflexi bacterium]|nr:DUF1638 domain-containing protein [Chloroflexota bacterium]
MTHYIALTCTALARSVYHIAASTPAAISVRLLDQGLHDRPRTLRQQLQAHIDAIEPGMCDAILLVYGLCGNATLGLRAEHTQMVLPRAHDCITLYLGSQQRYQQEFDDHPGTYWYSLEYLERSGNRGGLGAGFPSPMDDVYAEYVQKYGEDNANYLMEVMGEWSQHYTRAVYIDTGLVDGEALEAEARAQAARRDWQFMRLAGNRRLLEMLLEGEWSSDEFLVVPPGHAIERSAKNLLKAVP